MERLKATVVCADMKNSQIFTDFLTMCGYEILKTTQYGFDCVSDVLQNKPDVIVSDAHIYDFDVCTLYEQLECHGIAKDIAFVVLSSVTDSSLINKILGCGIDLFMLMPTDFWLLDKRIRELVDEKRFDKQKAAESTSKEFDILTHIKDIVHELGMSSGLSGYDYIIESVYACVNNKFGKKPEMTKALYPYIAKEFNSTSAAVERAMRSAIEKSWLLGNISFINEIFGYSVDAQKGRPSNAQYINTLTEKVKHDLKIE